MPWWFWFMFGAGVAGFIITIALIVFFVFFGFQFYR